MSLVVSADYDEAARFSAIPFNPAGSSPATIRSRSASPATKRRRGGRPREIGIRRNVPPIARRACRALDTQSAAGVMMIGVDGVELFVTGSRVQETFKARPRISEPCRFPIQRAETLVSWYLSLRSHKPC